MGRGRVIPRGILRTLLVMVGGISMRRVPDWGGARAGTGQLVLLNECMQVDDNDCQTWECEFYYCMPVYNWKCSVFRYASTCILHFVTVIAFARLYSCICKSSEIIQYFRCYSNCYISLIVLLGSLIFLDVIWGFLWKLFDLEEVRS